MRRVLVVVVALCVVLGLADPASAAGTGRSAGEAERHPDRRLVAAGRPSVGTCPTASRGAGGDIEGRCTDIEVRTARLSSAEMARTHRRLGKAAGAFTGMHAVSLEVTAHGQLDCVPASKILRGAFVRAGRGDPGGCPAPVAAARARFWVAPTAGGPAGSSA